MASKPKREGLPPVYVVVRGGVPLWHTAATFRRYCRTQYLDLPGDRIVKYLPAPARRAKGGAK